ncbi:branched-chain amino acid ABC transporter permease [Alicycliphilus denitrificans]|uniref:Branched-chain amino acid ABC transporter permease n=1 Tax=Alicycliphilus denitrificans TaxID=179636 RepID=A0A420KFR0_9BURK|nr:branched-chain amino acid ABC transporter permease [Alicycliphilus denitrificans]RKJ98769.1 branched-chain amino acid ABC transporter permease [Alicycliphilus denitrificans]HRP21813.1 branched-chain amino acid ABC transporter permease [Alicycliphilus sp.]
MSPELLFVQTLNGLQFGVLLFLMAAGLTLVFGIMSFINLAHGSLYMFGAYFAAVAFNASSSLLLAVAAGFAGVFALGALIDRFGFFVLHRRDHLDQVLATFGVVLFANEVARMIWGASPVFMELPEALSSSVPLLGINYPVYRMVIIAVGLLVAVGLYLLIERTRIGMLIRAGASNRSMVAALGVNIGWLNTFIFALGAGLAGLAGAMVGPILSVQPGMGDSILITTLVVIVIGGIGSIRGAFLGALVVGVVDTVGRTVVPLALRGTLEPETANTLGPALSSLAVYLLMAVVLAIKPDGLFPVKKR